MPEATSVVSPPGSGKSWARLLHRVAPPSAVAGRVSTQSLVYGIGSGSFLTAGAVSLLNGLTVAIHARNTSQVIPANLTSVESTEEIHVEEASLPAVRRIGNRHIPSLDTFERGERRGHNLG